MGHLDNLKRFKLGGQDTNSSPEDVSPEDYIAAWNFRVTGTSEGEDGYGTNPESAQLITQSLPDGICKGLGGGAFEDVGSIIYFRYNSAGHNQIVRYNKNSKTEQVIFTDITDSDGISILPLNPQNYVKAILINEIYLIWVATGLEVGYTNLNTLTNGGYGTVLAEDLSLLKPQCLIPITGVYGSDPGQPANYLYGNLPQFNVQYVNADFNYSAWSTWSKRIVPYQENTPTLGADVTQNNYIIVLVNIGSIRATTINIACRFALQIFSIIKSVDRSYVIALPNTSVDVSTQVYEAYDPSTNLYSFVFYNNTISIPVTPTTTDLAYDYIWPANCVEKINGNITGLSDLLVGHPRPQANVTVGAVGYDPNIAIPGGTYSDPFRTNGSFPGSSGSGAGDHKRKMSVSFAGTPRTGDKIIVTIADIRNASATITYTYTVPSGQDGNQVAVVGSFSEQIPGSNFYDNGNGTTTINFIGPPYYGLQTFSIQLFFAGASVSNSIPSALDNTVYQLAKSFRDGAGGRFFPLDTDNQFIVQTPSYAQVNGQAIEITWTINNPVAPVGAVDYQWLITKPPVNSMIDVLASLLDFKGSWDAHANSPGLAVNVGTVGDTYQITAPSLPTDTVNLGSGGPYNTGDYVVYNGQSWDIILKSFGDLTTTGNILAFSLNPLNLFTSQYAEEGVSTVLTYDFTPGDRCTLHYYINSSGNKVFINSPCVNLSVFGYDSGTYIVKVEKSATFDSTVLNGKNVFLRLYSPAQTNQTASTVQNTTVWYEIGERFTITNGMYDVLSGVIHDGGVYYKTRQYDDALLPYSNPPVQVLATDFNYSDFYASAYSSFGRPRTYDDELEQTERKAITITSQNYILGSKNNGLTRFYPANVYGEADGQTSSSNGAIQAMWQRGSVLVLIQELGIFYVPVNEAYVVLNEQTTGQSISEKLLNNGRYDTEGVGVGLAKEAFCFNKSTGFIIDPHRSEPFELTTGGVFPISGKMSKNFKALFSLAYSQGRKIVLFYNRYYDELMVCIEAEGGILTLFPFSPDSWNPFNDYVIAPTDVTATPNGSHSTASYDDTTGLVTYVPTTDYVGNDSTTFTFDVNEVPITVNNCLTWTAGSSVVNPFSFTALINQPVSTLLESNSVLIGGNTIPSPISISAGGEYSEDNGVTWASASGTVPNGAIVKVRIMSSASFSTETHTDLTIGTETERFSVTTEASAPTTSNIEIDNNSQNFGITSTTLRFGPTDYTYGVVSPSDNLTDVIDIGTYTVHVIIVGSFGFNGILTINGTDHAFSGGDTVSQSGVTTPILITLVDA